MLAQRQNRLASDITRALDADPDALLSEIVIVRLGMAQDIARDLISKDKGRAEKLRQLRRSDDFDDRLAVALYEQHQHTRAERKEADRKRKAPPEP